MARFSEDTVTFPMSVWKVRGQHLNTFPNVFAEAKKKGAKVKGTFEVELEDGKFILVLTRQFVD